MNMGRRPYITKPGRIIRDDLQARGHSNPHEYSRGCGGEPVGMDGRYDWFRWWCRECEEKYISMRNEKSMRYLQCTECGAWHHQYKGFFTQPDRKGGKETVPLKQSEVKGDLCTAVLEYKPESEYSNPERFYGTPELLQERMQDEKWGVVEHIKRVDEQ